MAQFRLSQLLRLRRIEDEQAAAELAHAHGRARETEAVVSRTRRALAEYGSEATDIDTLRAIAASRSATSSMLSELREQQGRDGADVAAAAAGYREASTRTRTLTRLEERWQRTQHEAELRAEQAALDEFAITRRGGSATGGTTAAGTGAGAIAEGERGAVA